MTDQNIPELLSLMDAAKILKVHPNTLRKWDQDGILKAVRFGKRKDRRYNKADVLNLITMKKTKT